MHMLCFWCSHLLAVALESLTILSSVINTYDSDRVYSSKAYYVMVSAKLFISPRGNDEMIYHLLPLSHNFCHLDFCTCIKTLKKIHECNIF